MIKTHFHLLSDSKPTHFFKTPAKIETSCSFVFSHFGKIFFQSLTSTRMAKNSRETSSHVELKKADDDNNKWLKVKNFLNARRGIRIRDFMFTFGFSTMQSSLIPRLLLNSINLP